MERHKRRYRRAQLAALVAVLPIACGVEAETGDALNTGPTFRAFEAAAIEMDVPHSLLLAIGWVESRWEMLDGEADHHHDHGPRAFGVMGLAEGRNLERAVDALGADPHAIRYRLQDNVRAAAALLSVTAARTLGEDYAERAALGDFRDVVAAYSGFDDPVIALYYAEEVYEILKHGAGRTLPHGEIIELFGAADAADEQALTEDAPEDPFGTLGQSLSRRDSPHVDAFDASPNHGARNQSIRRIVIHTCEGGWAGCLSTLKTQNTRGRVSAHYLVRSRDGHITQLVRESRAAWHAGNHNPDTIGIEHEGFASRPAYFTDEMYRRSAILVCDIARRHNIPLDRRHVVGHMEIAAKGDPGPHWDWDRFLALARSCGGSDPGGSGGGGSGGGVVPGTTANLQGVIHEAGHLGRRIAGATVTVAGQRAVTNANGYYSMRVPTGTHTISVSASGWQSASITRQVVAAGDAWGSVGLVRQAASQRGDGRLVGVVYEAPDATRRMSGATVTLSSGATATTDSNGYFSFTLPAGNYTVTASRAGYVQAGVSRRVVAGDTVWGSVGLARQRAEGVLRGVVYEAPHTNRRLAGATVRLSTGQSVTSSTSGAFEFRVPPGTHRITASHAGFGPATVVRSVGSAEEVWGSVGLSRSEGTGELVGVIYVRPDTGDRVAGAHVWTSTGHSATANENGVYVLDGVPAGPVSIFAGAPGLGSGAVLRTVEAGERTWGSVGLGPGSIDGGGEIENEIRLLSPALHEVTGPDPTFVWENVASDVAGGSAFSYLVTVGSLEEPILEERNTPGVAGGETRTTLGLALRPGPWFVTVHAVTDDGRSLGASIYTPFTVR